MGKPKGLYTGYWGGIQTSEGNADKVGLKTLSMHSILQMSNSSLFFSSAVSIVCDNG